MGANGAGDKRGPGDYPTGTVPNVSVRQVRRINGLLDFGAGVRVDLETNGDFNDARGCPFHDDVSS